MYILLYFGYCSWFGVGNGVSDNYVGFLLILLGKCWYVKFFGLVFFIKFKFMCDLGFVEKIDLENLIC